MKKLILLAFISALSTISFSQIKVGIQLGGNLANAKYEYTPGSGSVALKYKTKSKFGFLGGIVAEIPFSSSISFRPELNFVQKGTKFSDNNSSSKITFNYIELPLNFAYSIPAGPGKVFMGIGPSFAFGLSGKGKTTNTGYPDETTDIKFDGKKQEDINGGQGDDKVHMKAFDFGANVLAGYALNLGVYLQFGYTLGFSNIAPEKGDKWNNKGFAIKVGYLFGGSKAPKK